MNKYFVAIAILALAGFYSFDKLKKHYDKMNSSSEDIRQISNKELASPISNEIDGEVFYYVEVDRFADGNEANNQDVDLSNPLGFHGGDLKGLAQNLDQIKKLGATSIVLSPINKQIDSFIMYKSDSLGMSYKRYPFSGIINDNIEEVDKRFGSFRTLLDLIVKAHEMDLKVYLSMNLNNVYSRSSLLEKPDYQGFFRMPGQAKDCEVTKLYKAPCVLYGDPDYIHEDSAVQNYLIQTVKEKWARLGLDGFFLRQPSGLDQTFLANLGKTLKKDISDKIKIVTPFLKARARDLENYQKKKLIDYSYDDIFAEQLHKFLLKEQSNREFLEYLEYNFSSENPVQNAITYISHASGPSFFYKAFENPELAKLAFTMHVALGANPMIDFGEEFGKSNSGVPFIKSDFPWDDQKTSPGKFAPRTEGIFSHYQKLIKVYKKNRDLLKGHIMGVVFPKHPEVLCFVKLRDNKEEEGPRAFAQNLSCFNRSDETKVMEFRIFELWMPWLDGKGFTDIISGKKFPQNGDSMTITMPAYSGMILAPL